MTEERGFTSREIGAFIMYAVLGVLFGIGAYTLGGRLSGAHGGATVANVSSEGAVPDGKALYAASCLGCHGAKGEGGVGLPLAASAGWTEEQFKEAVLNGKAPTRELTAVMPRVSVTGLGGQPATDAQLTALHKYIQTLK